MSRRKTAALLIGGLLVGPAAITLIAQFALVAIRGEPFRMTLRRVDGQAVIQFARVDRGLISPEFPVNLSIESPRVFLLRDDKLSIPGCVVEFFDATMLPGRFKIRTGGVVYDVMERGILVGDEEFAWRATRPHTQAKPL